MGRFKVFKTITKLPVLLKGILHADDACKAIDCGMDGIIVSNHGGRQVDGSISTIEALPSIVDAVQNKLPVLMDSGIRGGADISKHWHWVQKQFALAGRMCTDSPLLENKA